MPGIHGTTSGYNQSIGGSGGDDTLTSGFGSASLDGGAGNDSLVADGYGNLLLGGPGDDWLDGGLGNATLDGGDGANWLHVAGYNDSISAGDGNNSVSGTEGNATIWLGNGANQVALAGWGNRVTTGNGADGITLAGGGNATISSGGGDDVIALGSGGGDSVDAGLGTDSVTYSGNASAYALHANGDGSVTVNGPGGTDTLRNVEALHFAGGSAAVNLNALLQPASVVPASNTVLFIADDGIHGTELWASDLTGTHLVVDLTPGAAGSTLLGLTSAGAVALFATDTPVGDFLHDTISVWESDGTAAGTFVLTSFQQFGGSFHGSFTVLDNGKALFRTGVGFDGYQNYSIDLTGNAPVTLTFAPLFPADNPVAVHGHTAVWAGYAVSGAATGSGLVVTDGTPGGTQVVTGALPANEFAGLGQADAVFGVPSFSASFIGDLLRYDAASDSIVSVATINAGGSAHITGLTRFGYGQVLFAADDGVHGNELWITDGTGAGTHMVADINPNPLWASGNAFPGTIVDLGNGRALVFADIGNPLAGGLLVTDGTTAGTQLLTSAVFAQPIVALGNGTALFTNIDSIFTGNVELWVSDGTVGGTHKVTDIAAGNVSSYPHDILALGDGRAVFSANDGTHGDETWITDGTAAGTHLLADIQPGAGSATPTSYVGIHYAPPAPIIATGYGQTIAGTGGADTITDPFGGAHVTGNGGDDSITLGGSGNQADGGAGADSIIGAGWGDSLSGGSGDDSLADTGGGATLDGGAGRDTLFATGWGNTLLGGAGNDSITVLNGGGNTIGAGDGDDTINLGLGGNNTLDAGAGSDLVIYSGAASAYALHNNGDGSITIAGPGGADLLRNVEAIHFQGGGADLNLNSFLHGATPATNLMLFTADDGIHGTELWASDGSTAHLVLDLTPGAGGSTILGLTGLGSAAVFATQALFPPGPGEPGHSEITIWRTDGTAAGTSVLTTEVLGYANPLGWQAGFVALGNGKALFEANAHVNDIRYFSVDLSGAAPVAVGDTWGGTTPVPVDASHALFINQIGSVVTITDGSPAGTVSFAGDGSGSAAGLGNGKLVYAGAPINNSNSGLNLQLYVHGTTDSAAPQLITINPAGSAEVSGLTSFGYGQALFAADDGTHGSELWLTDGSAAGTRMVTDLWAGGFGAGPHDITDLGNGRAIMGAQVDAFDQVLVFTDGTAAGTGIRHQSGYVRQTLALGNGLGLFIEQDYTTNPLFGSLWVTDGTAAGTQQLQAGSYGHPGAGSPFNLHAIGNGRAMFAGTDNVNGEELWITDGTVAGTYQVNDIVPGSGSSSPDQFAAITYSPPAPLVTTSYNQTLTGTGGADTLTGAFGNATLDGGAGNDSIAATGWGNHLLGGAGDDTLDGGAGNSTLEGGDGANIINASGWSDSISSGSGNDLITLTSGGNASISSGGGRDSIALGQGGGDVVDAGAGNDTVSYSGNAVDYRILRNADGSLSVSGLGGTDQLSHVEHVQFADGHFDPAAPTHGDLNGDHRADPVLQNVNGDVWTLLSTGGASEIYFDHQGFVALFVGDVRGDGGLEVLYQNPADGWLWLQETSGGAPLSQGGPGSFTMAQQAVGLADFDGDGRDDILLRDATTGAISIEQVNADFSATPLQPVATPGTAYAVVGTGDLSGDGRADILFHHTGGGYWLWEMNGATIGSQGAIADPGGTWQVKAIGDVNGDNHADLIWQDAGGNLDIWEMSGTSVLATGYLGSTGTWWTLIGAEDLTGDGRADLIFQGQDGALWDWTLNGTQVTGGGSLATPGAGWHLVA